MNRITFADLHNLDDRPRLTMSMVARLFDDWNRAGQPEDIMHFLATTDPWCMLPGFVFHNTFDAVTIERL